MPDVSLKIVLFVLIAALLSWRLFSYVIQNERYGDTLAFALIITAIVGLFFPAGPTGKEQGPSEPRSPSIGVAPVISARILALMKISDPETYDSILYFQRQKSLGALSERQAREFIGNTFGDHVMSLAPYASNDAISRYFGLVAQEVGDCLAQEGCQCYKTATGRTSTGSKFLLQMSDDYASAYEEVIYEMLRSAIEEEGEKPPHPSDFQIAYTERLLYAFDSSSQELQLLADPSRTRLRKNSHPLFCQAFQSFWTMVSESGSDTDAVVMRGYLSLYLYRGY